MRKFLFYLLLLKKLCFLLIYPLFYGNNFLSRKVRFYLENYLIFQPSKLRARRVRKELLKEITPLRFVTLDGVRLYAWYVKAEENKPTILFFHGQAESILSHQDITQWAVSNGYGIFMLSYRGHYKTWGPISENGIYIDAQTAINKLKSLKVNAEDIILWGHSLGSTVAVETAIHNKVRGVILHCPIKEINSASLDVNKFYCERLKIPYLENMIKFYLKHIHFLQKFDNLSKIKDINTPILLVHSKSDRIASYKNSVELANQNPNAKLYLSEKGNHWDANWALNEISEFIGNI